MLSVASFRSVCAKEIEKWQEPSGVKPETHGGGLRQLASDMQAQFYRPHLLTLWLTKLFCEVSYREWLLIEHEMNCDYYQRKITDVFCRKWDNFYKTLFWINIILHKINNKTDEQKMMRTVIISEAYMAFIN